MVARGVLPGRRIGPRTGPRPSNPFFDRTRPHLPPGSVSSPPKHPAGACWLRGSASPAVIPFRPGLFGTDRTPRVGHGRPLPTIGTDHPLPPRPGFPGRRSCSRNQTPSNLRMSQMPRLSLSGHPKGPRNPGPPNSSSSLPGQLSCWSPPIPGPDPWFSSANCFKVQAFFLFFRSLPHVRWSDHPEPCHSSVAPPSAQFKENL